MLHELRENMHTCSQIAKLTMQTYPFLAYGGGVGFSILLIFFIRQNILVAPCWAYVTREKTEVLQKGGTNFWEGQHFNFMFQVAEQIGEQLQATTMAFVYDYSKPPPYSDPIEKSPLTIA